MYIIPIKIRKILSPKFKDLSKKLPAIIGPIKLESSNKIINDAFAEMSFFPLNLLERIESDIVYMKYINPLPKKVKINEIKIEYRKKGIVEHMIIPRLDTA